MKGPLSGLRVLEFSALGPVPFCGRILSDLGADVIRIDRPSSDWTSDFFVDPNSLDARGRRSVAVDMKRPEGVATVLKLIDKADALIEGFRPGVLERLGLGPDVCLARNPRIVYGRCSGWGRSGPLASHAGHDLNYIAMAGILSMIGTPDQPPPPLLGLIGDHGGGAMLLAVGILAGLLESRQSGAGQVVDTSILDGATSLTSGYHEMLAMGARTDARGSSPIDGSAHFYNTYETSDKKYVAVGAIEPKFYAQLLGVMGLAGDTLPAQGDQSRWGEMKEVFARQFKTRTRDEWCAIPGSSDACLTPVLTLSEVPRHPHHVARGTFVEVGGVVEPAPVPHFERTPAAVPNRAPRRGEHTRTALIDWGFDNDEISRLIHAQALVCEQAGEDNPSGDFS